MSLRPSEEIEQEQEAGDGSANLQAAGNISGTTIIQTNNFGVTEERAREIAERASREVVLREGRAVAEALITERVDHITDRIFVHINERDTALYNRFEDPRFLAALTDAQRSYAETGDEDLGEVLAKLVVGLAAKPVRSMHEILLRKAISIAPQLTSPQLCALAVHTLLTRVHFNYPFSTEQLIDGLDTQFQRYYGKVPTNSNDYTYMASLGLGSHIAGLQDLGNQPYAVLHKQYPNSMYPALTADELEEAELAHDGAALQQILYAFPLNPEDLLETEQGQAVSRENVRFRVVPDSIKAIFRQKEAELSPLQIAVRKLIMSKSLSAKQFRDKVAELKPALHEFLTQLEDSKMMNFQPYGVGMVLARHELGDAAPNIAEQIDSAFDTL